MDKNDKEKFDNEEFVAHKPFAKVWLQDYGINSDVFLYKYYDSDKKSIRIKFGARKGGFELNEAIEMTNDILTYQKKLEEKFVPLPPIEKMHLEYDPVTHKIEIVKISTWTGIDAGAVIRTIDCDKEKDRLERLIRDMCRIVRLLCRDRESGWDLVIGIDPRSTNFTIDANHNVWFVDLFPPRFRKDGKPIIEWPKPKSKLGRKLGYFKHYCLPGIIFCMTAQLSRMKPKLKTYFENIVYEDFKKVMTSEEVEIFNKEVRKLPWIQVRNYLNDSSIGVSEKVDNLERIIKKSIDQKIFGVNYYIYSLREIVLEFAQSKMLSDKEVKNFFENSHFEDRLSTEKIDELIQELLAYTKRIEK